MLLCNRDKDKTNLFTDESLFPMVQKRKKEIKDVEKEMSDHRRTVRLILKQPAVDYVTVLGTEVKKFKLRLHNRKINTLTNNIRLYYGVRD